MHRVRAYKVDAFTTDPYTGNAAGVIPDAAGLTDGQMQAIAREMNLSETAFVWPATEAGSALRLRYFTPTQEIDLCGHATIAALHVLHGLGRVGTGEAVVETNVGNLPLLLEAADGGVRTWLGRRDFATSRPGADAARLLGIDRTQLVDPEPVAVNGVLLAELRDEALLAKLRPDLDGIARVDDVFTLMAFHDRGPDAEGPRTVSRVFAPAVGITEDPVTGVAHLALGAHLAREGRVGSPGAFEGEQGREIGRAGHVGVRVEGSPENPTVRVGGRAVTVLDGEMVLPPK